MTHICLKAAIDSKLLRFLIGSLRSLQFSKGLAPSRDQHAKMLGGNGVHGIIILQRIQQVSSDQNIKEMLRVLRLKLLIQLLHFEGRDHANIRQAANRFPDRITIGSLFGKGFKQ